MILVCSAGGVGTTAFIRWLSKYRTTNDPDDRDGMKHLISPPVDSSVEKAVYIYSSRPEVQVVSIAQRFGDRQGIKLTDKSLGIENYKYYLNYSDDPYDLAGIIQNWLTSNNTYDIAFVDFERMWEELHKLVEFLGLERSAADDFPARRRRKAEVILEEDTKLRDHLEKIYQQYKNVLNTQIYDNY